jgi:tetratricopeptide (TPR) repeat protein
MKKFTIAIALAFAFNLGFAQKDYNPESVKAKAEKSNAEIADAKAGASYKTWLKRAELFAELAEAPLVGAYQGMSDKEVDLLVGKPNASSDVQIGGKTYTKMEYNNIDLFFEGGKLQYWTIKNPGVEKPLITGFEAIDKAVTLDPKAAKKAKDIYGSYKNYFLKRANNEYNAGNKAEAAENFAYAFKTTANQVVNTPDTTVAYYAAFAYQEAGNNAEAAKYAQLCLDNKCYQNGDIYKILGEANAGMKDIAKAKEFYVKGLEAFPTNTSIIFGIINLYLSQNEDPKNILPFLDKAIELDPKNPSLYLVKGSFYEKFKDFDNAIATYKKAVEINPKYFEGWNNLGVVYYNVGVEFIDKSNKVDVNNQAEFDKLIKLADGQFKLALEQFLVAYSINPKDKDLVVNIKNIYFRFRNESEEMKKKYEEFNNLSQTM